jgi:hypothetical protein
MKMKVVMCIAALLAAGSASAATITVENAGTNNYGDAGGFVIDFDATSVTTADWIPDLVDGQIYSLDSVSMKYGGSQANTSPKYLGVYTGFSAGVLSGFLGVSTNSVDFATAAAGDWRQFDFSGIQVTADSTVGAGSGLLYFAYQTGTGELAGLETTVSTRRNEGFPGDPQMPIYLANILAFGAVQSPRAPQYQATLTPVVPEPTSLVLGGISCILLLSKRGQSRK